MTPQEWLNVLLGTGGLTAGAIAALWAFYSGRVVSGSKYDAERQECKLLREELNNEREKRLRDALDSKMILEAHLRRGDRE